MMKPTWSYLTFRSTPQLCPFFQKYQCPEAPNEFGLLSYKKNTHVSFVFFPVMGILLMGNGFLTFRGPCDRQEIGGK